MKKLIFLLVLACGLSAGYAQQLLKYNYAIREREAGTKEATKPGFQFDNYSSFVNNLGGGFSVLPNLKFNGTYYSGKNLVTNTAIFFAANNMDSLVPERANQLYFPEASTFGFHVSGSIGLRPIKKDLEVENSGDKTTKNGVVVGNRFSLNGGLFYLTKKLRDSVKETQREETAHMLHFKLGMEWAIVREHLSFFANVNHVSALTKRDFFRNAFSFNRNKFVFADAGFQARAELVDEKLETYITLGSIIHSGDTQSLSGGTTDLIVPYVKLGLYIPLSGH